MNDREKNIIETLREGNRELRAECNALQTQLQGISESHKKVCKGVSIRPHKGGRTERLEIRIEPEVKRLLLDHISQTGESYSDWITRKVKEDLEKNLSA